MMKKEKGITLVAIIITIIVMLIIVSTTVYLSMNKFEVNDVRKMYNDLELLEDKVQNYYFKYGKLPVLRNEDNDPIPYEYTQLSFETDARDNNTYYILDLAAMGNLTLNYGQEVLKKQGETDDVYIINEVSNTIYYVKGIEKEEVKYHYINKETTAVKDDIPPTKPQIKLVSGVEKTSEPGFYTTEVVIDIIAGKNNISGIEYTQYTIDGGLKWDSFEGDNKVLNINSNGIYNIKVKTYAKNGLISEEVSLKEIEVHIEHIFDKGVITKNATCTESGIKTYTCTHQKCDATYGDLIKELGHEYATKVEPEPTCTEDGTEYRICKREGCDFSKRIGPVAALGHDLKWEETKLATCERMGYDIYRCKRCDEMELKNKQEAIGHTAEQRNIERM